MIHDTWADSTTALGVELYYSGAWHDITDDVDRRGVRISRGRSAEAAIADPASCTLTLASDDGRYSLRNPRSPLYGLLGRSTPIRVYVEHGAVWCPCAGSTGYLTAPDSAGISVTGDLEVWVDVWQSDWRSAKRDLVSHWGAITNRGWAVQSLADGTLALYWSEDGSAILGAVSTALMPIVSGRMAVRVTLDVSNGGNHAVTFYTAPRIGDTWVQLGDPVIAAGVTSIFDSTEIVRIGKNSRTDAVGGDWRFFEARIYDGIGGTLEAAPKASDGVAGSATLTDSQGVVWTLGAGCELTRRHYRFTGTVASWPPTWGRKGASSVLVAVEGGGVMRRLGRGTSAMKSALRQGIPGIGTGLVAYWPCEDGADATTIGAAVGGRPGIVTGPVMMAAHTDLPASAPMPTISTGKLEFQPPTYTVSGEIQWRAVIAWPSTPLPNGCVVARVYTGGTMAWVDLIYTTAAGGSLEARPYDTSGTAIAGSSAAAFVVDGITSRLSIDTERIVGDVRLTLANVEVGASAGAAVGVTYVGYSTGRSARQIVNPARADLGELAIGHVTLENDQTSVFDIWRQADAYNGEETADRIDRLCTENGLTATILGEDDTESLGYQRIQSLTDALNGASVSDYGILYEHRGSYDLAYRSMTSMLSQNPAATIAHTDNLLVPFFPREDDASLKNRVTVTREGGSSTTAEVVDGPAGTTVAGTYDDSANLSLHADQQTELQAWWRANVGTVDDARYPTIGWDLAHPTFLADDTLTTDLLLLDLGDVLRITDPPVWLPPDDVTVVVQGLSETITPTGFKIEASTTPASAYRVLRYNTASDRWSNQETALSAPLSSATVDFAGGQCLTASGANVATDLEIRVQLSLDDWTPAAQSTVVAKYVNTGDQRSWALDVSTTGRLHMYLSVNGITFSEATSTAATGFTDGTVHWIRAVFHEDDGGVWTVKYYTSEDGGTWVQLGTTVSGGATLALFESTALYQLGARSGTACTSSMAGVIHAVEILDGVGGTPVVSSDPADWTPGYTGSGTGATVATATTSTAGWDVPYAPLWTHDDGDYDVSIGGERMTVTAVSGAATPQVVTVTRGVDGVVIPHVAGEQVLLHDPVRYGK